MALVEDPPLIRSVKVVDPEQQTVSVVWKGGARVGKEDTVDLSEALESRRHYYRLLLSRPNLFLDVSIVDGGRAIAWFNASITMSAEVIESLVPKRRVTDQALLAAAADSGLAPIIDSISPSFAYPGNTVTITGENFSGITGVFFTAQLVPASSFAVIDNGTITATLPANSGIPLV